MVKREIVHTEPNSFEIVIEREFAAPCELVYRAHVDPELLSKWYGCHAMSVRIEQFECKTGGSYRLFQKVGSSPEGISRGIFHEVMAETRIVKTEEFEGNRGSVSLETTRFEAMGINKTKVVKQLLFQSVQDRDALVEYGVRKGVQESFEKLDQLLK